MATLLLADVEGSTRLWESQSDEMTAAVARLDAVLAPKSSPSTRVFVPSSKVKVTAS